MDKKNIEDILPLTPMQEGMLFHYLKDPGSGYYFEQINLDISGEIDIELFEKAWTLIIESNEMLRAVFSWKKLKAPVQIILKSHQVTIRNYDLTDRENGIKSELLEEIKIKDRREKFDLQKVPFRLTLVKISEKKYYLIISTHHILYDGWSNGIIIKTFVQLYESLRKSGKAVPPGAPPYRNYIDWLSTRDKQEGLRYWEEYLDGYDRRATLPVSGAAQIIDGNYKREEYYFVIEESLSEGLKEIARNNRVSINTVFQILWGILLHRYNNTDDVVFGVVVSGRPSEIKDVNRMVGVFINTIPVRIKIGNKYSFVELLKEVHENKVLSTPYEYVPLADIQTHSLLKENLIDHILSFQNYPIEHPGESSGFKIEKVTSLEHTNYDFNFVLFPGSRFSAKLLFNCLKYPLGSIKKVILHFNEVLRQIVISPDIDIRKIRIMKNDGSNTGPREVEGKKIGSAGRERIEANFDF